MRRMLVVGAVVALAGCGGGSGGGSAKPEDQIRSTVQAFANDVAAGENGRACERATDRGKCLQSLITASGLLGAQSTRDLFKDAQVQWVKVTADTATAMVKGFDSATKLVKRGDRWLVVVE